MASAPLQMMQNAPQGPLTTQEEQTITVPAEPWSNKRALAIAVGNFEQMSSFRSTSGHDIRLQIAEELYLGWQPKKYWEGTKVPRSSLGVPVAQDQIEALMPAIMSSVFPLRDNVDIENNPGTSKDEAQAALDLIMAQMESANARENVRLAAKDGLVYGNGILEVYWHYEATKKRRLIPKWVPVTHPVFDPMIGQWTRVAVPGPDGSPLTRRILIEQEYDYVVNEPRLRRISPQDFFIDPNCESPDIQRARFCGTRQLITIGDIKKYRGQYGFQIPSDEILVAMAKNKVTSYHDTLKGQVETYRLGSWQPQNDYSTDPDTWRLECIRYYTKDRVVWVFNRMWVAYNNTNTLGEFPFLDAFYVDVPNRFYGLAITDAVEGEQRLQQAVINARIDELNLLINSPWVMTRGVQQSTSSMRMYPGKMIIADKPKEDIVRADWGNVTSQAYLEVSASDQRAQKRTGVTDTSVQGVASMGGNSANRTATGMNVQASAAGTRIRYQVENLESNFIEPMLKMFLKMNQLYLDPQQAIQVLGPLGQALQIDPVDVRNADVKFKVRGSEKMRQRQNLMQALPLITQTYFNPEFLQFMSLLGKKPDIAQWDRMISDAFQMAPMTLWADQTPEEAQQFQMQRMAPLLMQQQTTQAKLQTQQQIHQSKDDTTILTKIMDLIPEQAVNQLISGHPDPAGAALAKLQPKGGDNGNS